MTSPLTVSITLVVLAATLACEERASVRDPERVYTDRPPTWVPLFPSSESPATGIGPLSAEANGYGWSSSTREKGWNPSGSESSTVLPTSLLGYNATPFAGTRRPAPDTSIQMPLAA